MFSLVIAIVAIALVVALLVVGGFYGGSAVSDATSKAEATRLKNEEQQILAAVDMYRVDHRAWPPSVESLVAGRYLSSVPKGPRAAAQGMGDAGDGTGFVARMSPEPRDFHFISAAHAADTTVGWKSVVASQPIFVSSVSVSLDVCRQFNQLSRGDDGVLRSAYSILNSQCYGTEGDYKIVFFKPAPGVASLVDALAAGTVEAGGLPSPDGGTAWWDALPSGEVKAPLDPEKVPTALLAVSPGRIDFGRVALGASVTRQLTVQNKGNLALEGLSMPSTPTGVFIESTTCASTLAADSLCHVTLGYTPAAPGELQAQLNFDASNASGVRVAVQAFATQAELSCELGGTPCAFAFDDVQTGETSDLGPARMTNTGNVDLTGLALTLPAGFSAYQSSCGPLLAVGQSCDFTARFSPTDVQGYVGTFRAASAEGAEASIPLSGRGVAPQLSLVAGLGGVVSDFAGVVPGWSDSGVYQYFKNTGVGRVTLTDFVATGFSKVFGETSPNGESTGEDNTVCWRGRVLNPGNVCKTYLSTSMASSGSAVLTSTAGTLSLNGSLTTAGLALTGVAGSEAAPGAGVSAPVYTLTVSNPTNYYFHFVRRAAGGDLTTIGRFTGTDASKFTIAASTCGAKLAPNGTCTVSVALNGATEIRAYAGEFEVNGGYHQAQLGLNGDWNPADGLFTGCGGAVCDIFHGQWKSPVSGQAGVWLVADGSSRNWSNGTVADSCKAYRTPTGLNYRYQGATGSGTYRINTGGVTRDVACDMVSDGGGWTLVRRTAAGTAWAPANDNVTGTAVYGTYQPNSRAAATFSMAFSQMAHTELKFATGDGVKWAIVPRTSMSYITESCAIGVPVTATHVNSSPHSVAWCSRTSQPEDPWVSVYAHETTSATADNDTHSMLYGENGVNTGAWSFWLRNRDGANVFVR